MKALLVMLGAVALALCWTPAHGLAPDPPAADCEVNLDPLLAPGAAVCRAPEEPAEPLGLEPFTFATAPHCCGTGALDACRDSCRQLGSGCKGSIGCRVGECVCTCSCP